MRGTACRCVLVAAAVLALLAGAADPQQTRPASTAPAATGPSPRILQPPEFEQLARQAQQFKGVYIRGRGIVEADGSELPPELKQFTFEIWARPPAAKTRLAIPSQEERLCDGKYVYTFRQEPSGPRGRQRKLTPENFYHAVGLAAVVLDAASGYANLTTAVKLAPISPPLEYAEKFPDLKWFRLHPAGPGEAVHHLLRDTSEVKIGISRGDGLVRVLAAKLTLKDPPPTSTVLLEEVRQLKLEDEVFKLPASAAQAAWTDMDAKEAVAVPRQVIAEKSP